MKKLIKKYTLLSAELLGNGFWRIKNSIPALMACIFSFLLVFGTIYLTASRTIAIKKVRANMAQSIQWLNEAGLDIAYDNIEFNALFFSPLITIDNLQIYNIDGRNNRSNIDGMNSWSVTFNKIKAFSNIFGQPRIRFESSDGGLFMFNDFTSKMSSSQTFMDISSKDGKFNELVWHAEDINIHDFAKIKKIVFLLQALEHNNNSSSVTMPSYDSYFEVNNVEINGLLNYPLSSHLKLFYAQSEIIGRITPDDSLFTAMETWLKEGGFIEIPNLIVQWEPLTLVARGNVNFNEKFEPKMHLNTSSKGILRLINDLQENSFLDSKNVFVANILLSNKAFKLNPDDKELTISTPISYSDGKISIENLTIKDFTR